MSIANSLLRPPLVAALVLFVVPALSAGDWPQFRGPGGLGASNVKGIPTKWSPTENVAWKTPLPGQGASSPIALGERLYLTCYSGYGSYPANFGEMEALTLHVVCVDAKNGRIVWEKKLKPALPESKRVRDHGYAAPTPATDGEHLYVFFGKSGVYKFDLNGNEKWRAGVGSKTHGWGCGTSPVLFDDLVIVNASVESGSLVAIHKKTGKEAWSRGGMRSSWNTPHLVRLANGKTELVVSVKDKILAFDPKSGDPLWECDGIEDYVCPSIISHEGVVYAVGGRSSRAIAVRAGGRGDVTDSHLLWNAGAGANVSSPVIHEGHLYGVSDRNRTAYCIDLKTGDVVFKERFPGQPYASALLVDGKVYVVTRHSGTFVLPAKPKHEILSQNDLDDGSTFNASPIVAHGRLYLRSDKFLYAIGGK